LPPATFSLRTAAQALLLLAAAVSGAFLAARAAFGGIHTPMNLESVCADALLLLIIFRSRKNATTPAASNPCWPLVAIAALTIAAFAPFLNFPLLADDYTHIWNARHFTLSAGLAHFTQADPDHFFRPLVYLAYAAEAPLAQLHPAIWRSVSLAWHTAGALLVYLLIRRMIPAGAGADTQACFAGATSFAIGGTRPEAVTWVAARFDLMATMLGLAALYLLLRGRTLTSASLLLAALLSKESALVFPLLAVLLLSYEQNDLRAIARRTWPWFAVSGVVFVWRMAVLGGIGGYRNAATGTPTVFNLGLRTPYGLLLRSWDAMFFPLNWAHVPGVFIAVLLALAVASFARLAWNRADRRLALTGIAFFLVAALPAHQFLPVGLDLEKARVLYLPSVGFAMLLAALLRDKRAWMAILPVLAFQLAALWHNLAEWRAVGNLAGRTCADLVARLDRSPGPIAVPQFLNTVDGVYFLKTGYPACVWLQRPARQKDVRTLPPK
jgi:hypothetical protein